MQGAIDPLLERALRICGQRRELYDHIYEFYLWTDPKSVMVRHGCDQTGSISPLYPEEGGAQGQM